MKISRITAVWIALGIIGFGMLVAPRPAMAQRPLGIDVSHYQGVIDWANVGQSGVIFSFVKATEGTGYVDPTFASNVVSSKAGGVLTGCYHFAHPDDNADLAGADAEAAFFWSTISNYVITDGLSLVPVLDYETDPGSNYTTASSSAWVNEWCQDMVNYGISNGIVIKPIVYTFTSFAPTWLDTSVTNWTLWMASPNGRNPLTGAPSRTRPWPTWQFWQYGETNLTGIPSGPCDADVFNGTTSTLTNYMIHGIIPAFTQQPSNVVVVESGTAVFTATATTVTVKYQWQFGGTNIPGATNGTLTLTNVQMSAAGTYSVMASNIYGTKSSLNALLIVQPLVVISNVAVIPRPSSAIISWDTTTNATSQAVFGVDPSSMFAMAPTTNLTLHHALLLNGLSPLTNYYFQLISRNGPYSGTYASNFTTDASLILLASQAAYSGVWTIGTAAPDHYSPYYEFANTSAGNSTATAIFRPMIITPALYDVYVWYSVGTNRSANAPVVVSYSGGSSSANLDETTNGGSWQLVASRVNFAAGTNGFVRISNDSGESGKIVIADAVRLAYSAGQDLVVGNTMPTWWTSFYFGTNVVTAGQDTDGDGYSALSEFITATDPGNAGSHLQVRTQPAVGGGLQVMFSPYAAGRTYQLQSRANLGSGVWTNVPNSGVTVNTNGEGVMTVTNLTGIRNYVRLSVQMSP